MSTERDTTFDGAPPHVLAWVEFLRRVDVRGPIPCRFRVHQDRHGAWLLESEMLVPDRDTPHDCEFCERVYHERWIAFVNALPEAATDSERRIAVRQRVLGMWQHESLESIYIDGVRAFDPHEARWYSNLVVDWRYNT